MDKYYTQTRHEMLPFVQSDYAGKILDVGCGQGVFGALLKKEHGSEVWGVEMMEQEARVAEGVLDRVFCGSLDDVFSELPEGYFDCIVFNDVLEHMVDPYSVLDKVKSLLGRQGVVVCSIPNVRHFPTIFELLFEKDWRYRDSGVLDRTHLRFFTKKSIQRMFSEQGYAEKQITGINSLTSKKMLLLYSLANVLTLGLLSDSRYQQYACVMIPVEGSD